LFIQKLEQEVKSKGGKDLNSYLILPVQRVPRYSLLLRELIGCYEKYDKKNTQDYKSLVKAFEEIKTTTKDINKRVRTIENLNKLSELQKELDRNYEYLKEEYEKNKIKFKKEKEELSKLVKPVHGKIVEAGRSHVYSSKTPMMVILDENFREELHQVYLLTDSIVWLKPTENTEEYGTMLSGILNLKSNPVPWCKELLCDKRCFQVIGNKVSIILKKLKNLEKNQMNGEVKEKNGLI